MNEQIAQLQDSDPEFARTLKRLRAASYGLAAAIVLAASLGLWAVVVNSEQATQITKIQKTPCTVDPEGKACTMIKERIARHGSIKNPCIEHQRVEGTKGRNCPQFFIPHGPKRQLQANSKEVQNLELGSDIGSLSPNEWGNHKSSITPHSEGTSGGTPGEPKQPSNHHEPQPKAESEPAPVDTGTDTTATEPRREEATRPPANSAASEAPGLIGNPGGTVGEVVCNATDVVNELAGVRVCSK